MYACILFKKIQSVEKRYFNVTALVPYIWLKCYAVLLYSCHNAGMYTQISQTKQLRSDKLKGILFPVDFRLIQRNTHWCRMVYGSGFGNVIIYISDCGLISASTITPKIRVIFSFAMLLFMDVLLLFVSLSTGCFSVSVKIHQYNIFVSYPLRLIYDNFGRDWD